MSMLGAHKLTHSPEEFYIVAAFCGLQIQWTCGGESPLASLLLLLSVGLG